VKTPFPAAEIAAVDRSFYTGLLQLNKTEQQKMPIRMKILGI